MIIFTQIWNTNTTVLIDTETARKFLSYFNDHLADYQVLLKRYKDEKKIIKEAISVHPSGSFLFFILSFDTRSSYDEFVKELKNTNYFRFFIKFLGWKIKKMGTSNEE
jgi:hypothetical protein